MDRIPALPKGARADRPDPLPLGRARVQGMRREERHQVLGDGDRSDARSSPAVGDAEGLVQVQVRHVAAELSRLGQPEQRVEVRAVDVDLAPVPVDQRAHVADAFLVHAVRRGVRDHDGGQALTVFFALAAEVVEIDSAVTERGDHHDPHARHDRRRCVRAVRAGRDEADVAALVAPLPVIGGDGQESGQLPLAPCVGLDRHLGVAGDPGQPLLQLVDERQVARCGLERGEGVDVGEPGQADRLHLGRRVQLHGARTERDHATVECEVLVGEAAQVAQHRGLGVVFREHGVGEDRAPAQECLGQGRLGGAPGHLDAGGGAEGLEHHRDVRRGRGLAARDADVVLVDQAQEHAALGGFGHDRRRPAGCLDDHRVEERRVDEREAGSLQAARPDQRRGRGRDGRCRASPSAPWYTAYMEATTASRTWAVQMLEVAFSRRMCCSRVWSASR